MGVQLWPGPLLSATMRRHPSLGGARTDGLYLYGRVRYTSGGWIVDASTDSAGLSSAGLAFDAGTLIVVFAGFTLVPTAQVSRTNAIYIPVVIAQGSGSVAIQWYSGTTLQTVADTNMDVYLHVLGT